MGKLAKKLSENSKKGSFSNKQSSGQSYGTEFLDTFFNYLKPLVLVNLFLLTILCQLLPVDAYIELAMSSLSS